MASALALASCTTKLTEEIGPFAEVSVVGGFHRGSVNEKQRDFQVWIRFGCIRPGWFFQLVISETETKPWNSSTQMKDLVGD